jgi:DnaK suppressor protein
MAVLGKMKDSKGRANIGKGKKAVAAKKLAPVKKTAPVKTEEKAAPATKLKPEKKNAEKADRQTDRLRELSESLNKRKDAIVKEAKNEIAKYISGEHRQLVDTALDDGDWAVVDISEDINLMRLATHRKTLIEIDEALRKIAEGTYGVCEECGEEISARRLSVIPAATLCVGCKETKEQIEAVEREEIR